MTIAARLENDTGQCPRVSILVVGYNSAELIVSCLAAIPAACTRYSYEVLLIDNGDGTTEALVREKFPGTAIVASRGNVGFAAGNNALAEKASGRYLLLLNPDLEMKPGALDELVDAAARYPDAAAWGGVTIDGDGVPDLGNSVHLPSLREMASRTLGKSSAGLKTPDGITKDARVDVLSGSFVLLSRAAWDEVGGFDERYFLYSEEIDLFHRLATRGHTFWRIASARGRHEIGHGRALSSTRMLYRAAGTMQFARSHWGRPRQFAAFLLLWLGALQRLVLGRLIGRWHAHYARIGEGHRDIAIFPHFWRHGYDPQRGLLARMKQGGSLPA